MATKIQIRRDTASDWTSTNPTLAAGEIGFESDTNKFKIGDGTTAWTSLNYAPEGYITDVVSDTTPQLGGDLDVNGNAIKGSTVSIEGATGEFMITATENGPVALRYDNNLKLTTKSDGVDITGELQADSLDIDGNADISGTLNTHTIPGGTGTIALTSDISNIETADIAAGTLVTAAEGIASNDNDTTIPTSAAVKAYADSVGGGGSATGLTFVGDDSTGTLISDGETVKIAGGTGITTAMSGDTMTITASGGANTGDITFTGSTIQSPSNADITLDPGGTGDVVMPAISFQDNLITTNRSNDNLNIAANGTGRINISTTGSDFFNDTDNALYYTNFGQSSNISTIGLIQNDSVDANTTSRRYLLGLAQNTTLTGSSATNSDFRPRAFQGANTVDMAGYSYTRTGNTRGPLGFDVRVNLLNSSATASTLEHARGAVASVDAYSDSSGYFDGDLTINNADVFRSQVYLDSYIGTGNITVGTATAYHARAYAGSSDTITTFYGFYNEGSSGGGTVTNEYAFYDASNSLSVFGDIQTQAVSITDNHITTNRSNDHLHISANGTGKVNISNSDAVPEDNLVYTTGFGVIDRNKGVRIWESVSAQGEMTTSTDRDYGHLLAKEWRLTSGLTSSDSDNRYRAFNSVAAVDLNGGAITATSSYSGPSGGNSFVYLQNSNASAATMNHTTGFTGGIYLYPTAGAITATNTYAVRADIDFDGSSASASGTNGYLFHAAMYSDGGTTSLTNGYGVYISDLSLATNKYAFWDNTNSLSRFGAVILANQAGDPSTVTDSAHIYAKDVSASSEVFVRDEAGNVTQISPHNEAGEWQYWSENVKTGKKVRVNMERMIRRLEEITGEKFIENE